MTVGLNLQANLDQAKSLIQIAAKKGVKLLVLPENFAYFGQPKVKTIASQQENGGQARTFLSEQAIKNKIEIVGGTIPVINAQASSKSPSSSCFVLDDSGFEVACYKKIHRFDAMLDDSVGSYCESSDYSSGEQPIIVDTPIGSLGLAVCYDLRFPYTSFNDSEYDILLNVANWPSARMAHWDALLQARSIENQAYVLACNRVGEQLDKDGKAFYYPGHSSVYSPSGEQLAHSLKEEVIEISLDKKEKIGRAHV